MKILYDHQAFAMQSRGGVSRCFAELVNKMTTETGTKIVLSLLYSNNEYLRRKDTRERDRVSSYQIGSKARIKEVLRKNRYAMKAHVFLGEYLNKVQSIRYLLRQDFDVFHPTYYDSYFLQYLGKKPFVLTVHDMIHELFPEYFSRNDETSKRKRLLVERAERIIAVSQNTKDDLVRLLKVDPAKVVVVHHANFLERINEEPIDLPPRYILYVGGRKRYKNFSFFLESIADSLRRENDLHILCIGGGEFATDEKELFSRLSIETKVSHARANDAQLIYAYRRALCLALPSLYEGFGIPILEAFACGCPVLLSDASCFPEIARDAGVYFDPKNKDSIVSATERILNDSNLRSVLVQKGSERLRDFSSPVMVRATNAVYKECMIH